MGMGMDQEDGRRETRAGDNSKEIGLDLMDKEGWL